MFLFFVLLMGMAPPELEARFNEDFEKSLSRWQLVGEESITIRDSGDEAHGKILQLQPNEVVYALVRRSGNWGNVRVEADFLFPDDTDSYLGFIYNYSDQGRTDFGNIYIKGNGSYLRANPRRDGNVSRLLYEEYRTPLKGSDAIVIGKWHRMMSEIQGNTCHFYVDDMTTPKLTFDLHERKSGLVGFEPRVVGSPVWIDNVRITSIDQLSYTGPPIPEIKYSPEKLVTNWEFLGPFDRPIRAVENAPSGSSLLIGGRRTEWQPFETDRRGAVITGRITEYFGSKPIAYFRTIVQSDTRKEVSLRISTTDEIAYSVNGQFEGFIYRDGYMSGEDDWNAWHDFWNNSDRAGRNAPVSLQPGENVILLRVRNGQFASGGFFARLEGE